MIALISRRWWFGIVGLAWLAAAWGRTGVGASACQHGIQVPFRSDRGPRTDSPDRAVVHLLPGRSPFDAVANADPVSSLAQAIPAAGPASRRPESRAESNARQQQPPVRPDAHAVSDRPLRLRFEHSTRELRPGPGAELLVPEPIGRLGDRSEPVRWCAGSFYLFFGRRVADLWEMQQAAESLEKSFLGITPCPNPNSAILGKKKHAPLIRRPHTNGLHSATRHR